MKDKKKDKKGTQRTQLINDVNNPQTEGEIKAIRDCVRKGSPFRSEIFISQSAVRLKLEEKLRSRGRPKKTTPK